MRDVPTEELFHLGIKLLVLNGEGRILLLRFPSGDWDLPGGRAQRGEDMLNRPESFGNSSTIEPT